MNARGQAFSTFQLLISAIVAIAILMILLSVLNIIPIMPGRDPVEVIGGSLKDAYSSLASVKSVGQVTLERDTLISAENLKEKADIGLDPQQICISPGSYMRKSEIVASPDEATGEKDFAVSDRGLWLKYSGTRKDVSVIVVCHRTPQKLYSYLEGTYGSSWAEWMDSSGFRCECLDNEDYSDDYCCLVALRPKS